MAVIKKITLNFKKGSVDLIGQTKLGKDEKRFEAAFRSCLRFTGQQNVKADENSN